MNKTFTIEKLSEKHRIPIMDIFNYYIENSFAAYFEKKMDYEFYDMFLKISKGYPAAVLVDEDGNVAGFGFLHSHNPIPAFKHAAEISYFLDYNYTGRGLGNLILNYLLDEAEKNDLKCILASISSLNDNSLKFHSKNEFKECGRFIKAGFKNNTYFDVIWMERLLADEQ